MFERKLRANIEQKNRLFETLYHAPAISCRADCRGVSRLRGAAAPARLRYGRLADGRAGPGQADPLRRRARGVAGRGFRDVSLHHFLQRQRRRRGHRDRRFAEGDRPRSRHHEGVYHARWRRAVPDGTERWTSAAGLRERGGEFGATTGRPRRCGWCDAVAVRHTVAICGVDSIAMTKLDVLSGLETISVATEYRYNRALLMLAFRPARKCWRSASRSIARSQAGKRTSPSAGRFRTCRPTPART